jgi:hypothetical protein
MTYKEETQRKIFLLEQAITLSTDIHKKVMWRIMIQDLQWSLERA